MDPLQQDYLILKGDQKMISKKQWIDDYLDLYLYAKKIKDHEWAQQILQKLQNADQLYLRENIQKERNNLWNQFKTVNEQILTLYKKIRNENTNYADTETDFQQLMDLRNLRKQLINKIKEYDKKEKETLA